MAAPISKVGLAAVAAGGAVAYTLASASFYTISSGSKVSQRGPRLNVLVFFLVSSHNNFLTFSPSLLLLQAVVLANDEGAKPTIVDEGMHFKSPFSSGLVITEYSLRPALHSVSTRCLYILPFHTLFFWACNYRIQS